MPKKLFEKGNPGGPGKKPTGRSDKALLEARKLTKDMILDIFTLYLSMDLSTLKELMNDPSKPTMHHIVGNIALAVIEEGNLAGVDLLLNRVLGKVTDKVELSQVEPVTIEFNDGSQIITKLDKKGA